MKYRDYNPEIAHFVQPDPLGYAAGDVEVCGWCLDNPVNLVDPLGLENESNGGWKTSSWNPARYYTDPDFRDKANSVIGENVDRWKEDMNFLLNGPHSNFLRGGRQRFVEDAVIPAMKQDPKDTAFK